MHDAAALIIMLMIVLLSGVSTTAVVIVLLYVVGVWSARHVARAEEMQRLYNENKRRK
jgi:hypothetical protein